jgi:hypothetical protein
VKESSSFLKKRTKKLLQVWLGPTGKTAAEIIKSFLLLFFKKEGLTSCQYPGGGGGGG